MPSRFELLKEVAFAEAKKGKKGKKPGKGAHVDFAEIGTFAQVSKTHPNRRQSSSFGCSCDTCQRPGRPQLHRCYLGSLHSLPQFGQVCSRITQEKLTETSAPYQLASLDGPNHPYEAESIEPAGYFEH